MFVRLCGILGVKGLRSQAHRCGPIFLRARYLVAVRKLCTQASRSAPCVPFLEELFRAVNLGLVNACRSTKRSAPCRVEQMLSNETLYMYTPVVYDKFRAHTMCQSAKLSNETLPVRRAPRGKRLVYKFRALSADIFCVRGARAD